MSIHNSKQISDVKILLKTGVDGVGIVDIEKTGTQGLVDTYTITLSNGIKYTFTVTNGNGIESIEKTGTQGLVDTFTITFDDGTTETFTVTNGNGIESIENTGTQGLVDTYTITFDDGTTKTFTVTNGKDGEDGKDGKDGADGGMSAKFLITSDAGSTVSVTTPSGTVISATQVSGSTTQWECESTEYGTHTINSVLSNVTASTTVNVDTCKMYSATVLHFNATITVTYSPSDAVCTCVGGSESYTATSSPATFTVHSARTYTITVTKDSTTKTESVVITTDGQSASKSIALVPNGSTVTPTGDIQTWLHCADIWNKNYTTITQVLSDTTTLLALISNSNAVDYMARSTSWASNVTANSTAMTYIGNNNYCATKLLSDSTWRNAICDSTYFESVLKVKVPTMTSNTAPSGQAGANSGDTSAYKAFDNNSSTHWTATANYSNALVYYKFPNATCVNKIKIHSHNMNAYPVIMNFDFIVSNDGVNWTTVGSYTLNTVNETSFIIPNTTKYIYCGIRATSVNGAYTTVASLQMYGRA